MRVAFHRARLRERPSVHAWYLCSNAENSKRVFGAVIPPGHVEVCWVAVVALQY